MRLLFAVVAVLEILMLSCVPQVKKDAACSSSAGNLTPNKDSEFIAKGIVHDRLGTPLQDVKVTIISRSGDETKCTYTNIDGTWQLALSKGGIPFTVRFAKVGHYGLELFDLDLMKFPFLPVELIAFNDQGALQVNLTIETCCGGLGQGNC